MRLRSCACAVGLLASVLLSRPAHAALVDDANTEPLCEEETVYGTVILLDEDLGLFGLLGTRYKFQSMEELDLGSLQGRMVKIDIGPDCGIEDIRVLDGATESITLDSRMVRGGECS
jgi:hypothetical protein